MQNDKLLSEMIDSLHKNREAQRKLKAKIAPQLIVLEEEATEIEQKLQARMDEVGTSSARGALASYSYSKPEVFVFADPAKFFKWVATPEHIHCLEKRLSQKSLKEIAAKRRGGKIPGLNTEERPRAQLSTLGPK